MSTDPRAQFGPVAGRYLTSSVHADNQALQTLAALLGPGLGRVLDVATGAGHLAFALAPEAAEVVALDLTQEMLEVTETEALRRGFAHVRVQLGRAEEMPFPDGHFNVVACRSAAHHFDDVGRFLAESRRVLAPRGRLLIVDTLGADDPAADEALDDLERRRDPSHRRDYTLAAWLAMVGEAGFRVVAREVRQKRLGLQEWLDRMAVPAAEQEALRAEILSSTGALREYLQPEEDAFHLNELTLVAERLPDPEPEP